jgi:hypothetical protein
LTSSGNPGISSRRVAALAAAVFRMTQHRVAAGGSSAEFGSPYVLRNLLDKHLPLFTGQELEEVRNRIQQQVWISIVKIRFGEEVGTDHFQAIATALVASQHQCCLIACSIMGIWLLYSLK